MAQRILIIGGGIGGLSAALGLQNAGFDVRVVERAPAFGEIGAGITIGLPAGRALDFLGVGDTVRSAADVPKRPIIAHYKTGLPISGFRTDDEAPFDPSTSFHQIHRADLHRILADAVRARDSDAILLGRDVTAVTQSPSDVTVEFADGGMLDGAALVGCDGLRSTIRDHLFGAEKPRFSGQVAYRFLTPADRVQPFLRVAASAHFFGQGRSFVRYLVRKQTMLNNVAFVSTDRWTEEGWSIRSSRAELLEHFEGWNDDVLGLIHNAPEDAIYKWALFDREPVSVWSDRRATLLGDAAHPMLPFLGLGAAIAMEDAVLLARAMRQTVKAGGGIPHAFKVYEAARKERASEILLASRRQGEIFNTVDPDQYQATARPTANFEMYAYDPAKQPLPEDAA